MNARARRWLLLARIDARQPATWLALVVAAGAAALLSDASPAGWPAPAVVATLLGATVGVMALGDADHLCGSEGIDAVWVAVRIAWPLLGWAVAAALRPSWPMLACGGAGIVAAAILVAALVRQGALVADAASAALVAAGTSAAAGWWADSQWLERPPGTAVAPAVFALVAICCSAAIRPMPALRTGLRPLLTAVGMAGALAGMTGWLFLASDRAALDLAASLALFAALAVPAATLGDGVSHAAVWRRLERATPRAAGGAPRLQPGRTRDGVLAALTTAALLGWPPLVAAAFSGVGLARSWPAASVAVALVAAAGALLVIVWLGERAAMSPATVQAVALGGACVALAGTMAGRAAGPAVAPFFLVFGW